MREGENCGECGFWEPIPKESAVLAQNNDVLRGRCHKDAPKATPVIVPEVNQISGQVKTSVIELTTWPITFPTAWCGQFEPYDAKKNLPVEETAGAAT